ncbi:MAG: hypothetical protein RI894_216 [Bacteroidota bacterium]|jgi:hypothetical protein
MQKIDKTALHRLSLDYKKWEEDLAANHSPHPRYYSSNGSFYKDIVMDLFRCQNGLCAYTEVRLCAPDFYDAKNWANGKYSNETAKHKGELDHYDPDLKSKPKKTGTGTDWQWDNFFMIDSSTNRDKKNKQVVDFLKPDTADYSPEKYFEYNKTLGKFFAKRDLAPATKAKVTEMLETLGINHPTIVHHRKSAVAAYFEYGVPYDEFPTAIAFFAKK